MKIKFLAKGIAPRSYNISGSVINGIDTAPFVEGSVFVGNESTKEAGIFNMQWVNGELHVTLGQMTKAYDLTIYSHDWAEGEWINASDYSPAVCYVVASRPKASYLIESGHAEYFQDTDGRWTVRMINKPTQVEVA
jgi:hypothetical protein